MEDVYKTIETPAEGLYKEKGSKFIALAYPVRTEEAVKEIVGEIKVRYYDARHHCYAYRLGADKKKFRANDDGEPSSTAGKPILGQILSYDLTDILIVVVRYFGGIKLGVSGLINAYRAAAADAIGHARIVEKTDDEVFRIKFDYTVMNEVMRVVKEEEPEVMSRDFSMECRMTLSIRKQNASRLSSRLQQIESLSFEN
ncbi:MULTISPECIES: IMPACT family protein [Culturomica]|uniref:IMPACT family protein n=1 Tax=Culturomica TaxID=1926651 RepID=UPI000E966289|nr:MULTISPECIES: YigZ family protein [Culturomica]HBO27913.1 YigZ family protein [Culturomica sp.]